MTGAQLSAKAIKYIETKYTGYVVNVIVSSKSGTADIIACIKSNFFAFEIKGKGDTEKLLQDKKLNDVAKAGGYGGYVRKLSDIDYIVTNLVSPSISKPVTRLKL